MLLSGLGVLFVGDNRKVLTLEHKFAFKNKKNLRTPRMNSIKLNIQTFSYISTSPATFNLPQKVVKLFN